MNFSYIDNETFEERYVTVPEQGGGKLMQTLTDRQREVIELYYGDETVTETQVAFWLGIDQRTVSDHRRKAEERIREYCLG